MAGIYIHIPFCKQRCRYCAFYSSTKGELQQRYVDALCKEIVERRCYVEGGIETVYIGGGTPSTLSIPLLDKILNVLFCNYSVSNNAEITMEANPDDVNSDYLREVRRLSVNRLSMGVQSFDDKLLRMLGRRHTAQRAREAVGDARDAGFNNISIDLMFALPTSTLDSWRSDLENVASLRPNHLSAYNLTYEEDTPLFNALQKGGIEPLSEDENIKQFELLADTLFHLGYKHYEISNFALPGYESRHNSSYWRDVPYIGCGASAHSYNGKERSWNIADIERYIEGVENGDRLYDVELLSKTDLYNDAIVTRLRTSDGLPLEWFKQKFNKKLNDYLRMNMAPHLINGTLKEHNGCVSLTRKGIFISDSIMRDLIYIE